jgi:MFS family permease
MKKGLKFLLLADAWQIYALGLIAPIYAVFVEKIGGDILDASWGYFAFMMTTGVATYFLGQWEDRVKHKERLVIFGYLLTAIGCISYIYVSNQLGLVLTQIVFGMSVAVKNPAYDALYTEYMDEHKEASAWADWEAMSYATTAIAALIGGYFANRYGFTALFIFMFVSALLSMLTASIFFWKKRYLNSR